MNARLHDSVVSTGARESFDAAAVRDGLRLRKLGLLLARGDWHAGPLAEAGTHGRLTGPNADDLAALRRLIDASTPSRQEVNL